MDILFQKLARYTSDFAGTPFVFGISFLLVVIWFVLGPFMHWSDTWQLIITSISSVVTFLMVFLIQYAQNKDTKALQIKLDELLRTHKKARKDLVNIEQKPNAILEKKEKEVITNAKSNKHSK